jgi:uncharacterized membrane protein YqaE (UPF0057 family)
MNGDTRLMIILILLSFLCPPWAVLSYVRLSESIHEYGALYVAIYGVLLPVAAFILTLLLYFPGVLMALILLARVNFGKGYSGEMWDVVFACRLWLTAVGL